jgi:hypothetical protein
MDAVGNHLVPMYRVIGPTAAVALLILFLVGVVRMLADIVIRAIAIARVRACGWWLTGAFWGTLFHNAVAPVQWAMEKGHIVGKTIGYQMDAEAARATKDDPEAQGLNPGEPGQPSAPRGPLNNLERLVNWSHEFLNRNQETRIYPAPHDQGCPQTPEGKSGTKAWRTRTPEADVYPTCEQDFDSFPIRECAAYIGIDGMRIEKEPRH